MTPILPASGVIDGINTAFHTITPYHPGSLAIWQNGQLLQKDEASGYIATDPTTGLFDMKIPPIVNDTLMCYYIDDFPSIPESSITQMKGTLVETDQIFAKIDRVIDVSNEEPFFQDDEKAKDWFGN